jgi:hypothetical protein
MRVRTEQRQVYGQGWRLVRALRELEAPVVARVLPMVDGNARLAAGYARMALKRLAELDMRRFGQGEDEQLVRMMVAFVQRKVGERRERLAWRGRAT